MNDSAEKGEDYLRTNKTMRTMRVLWTILTAVFGALVLWRLYQWSNGRDNLRGILSPLGMIFVGAGAIIRPHNRNLSYVFTAVAMVLVISGLVLMFIY